MLEGVSKLGLFDVELLFDVEPFCHLYLPSKWQTESLLHLRVIQHHLQEYSLMMQLTGAC